ncbi:MAG: sulfite exporter TauE/SafE family protein [Flavobacteriales bacterium]|nr:sulfite exporter TauE/SafE family protein [Flavobacteriales bacterium]
MLTAALLLLAAFGASLLTFVSGFGLGTLLLPAFALFVPLPVAVTLTAVVHVLNNLFKFSLLRQHVHRPTVFRFGLPAIGGALLGAWLLVRLGKLEPLYYGVYHPVGPLQVTIALLMVLFAFLELSPAMRNYRFPAHVQTLGGLVSGFFGGLSGHQGALRSMFLVHGGLSKEGYVATGTAIALLVDFTRIPFYLGSMDVSPLTDQLPLLIGCVLAAFAGAWWGRKLLPSLTYRGVQFAVAVLLLGVAAGLLGGVI